MMRAMRITIAMWLLAASGSAAECPPNDEDCFQTAAINAMKAADWGAAVTAWERAYAAQPDGAFVFNLASTYDQWGGHCREALAAFDRYFAVCPEGADCPQRAIARTRQAHIAEKCHGTLKVETVPPGAEVSIDDEPRGAAPVEVRLLEGTYRVVARHAEGERVEQAARINGGQTTDLELRFEAPEPAPVPAPALAPTVVVQGPAPPPARQPESRFGAWKWTAFGVGAVGVAAGLAFTVTSMQAVSDESDERDKGEAADRDRVLGLQDDAVRDAVLANVGYGVGVLGLTAGVVMLLLDAPEGEPTAWQPVLGPGVAGLRARF